jgi:hypothetical protein
LKIKLADCASLCATFFIIKGLGIKLSYVSLQLTCQMMNGYKYGVFTWHILKRKVDRHTDSR